MDKRHLFVGIALTVVVSGASYFAWQLGTGLLVKKTKITAEPVPTPTPVAFLESSDARRDTIELLRPGWTKQEEYARLYRDFLHSSDIEVNLQGIVDLIEPGKIVLRRNQQRLVIVNDAEPEKTAYYDQPETGKGRLSRISVVDLRSGDSVYVTVIIDSETGRQRIRAVYRTRPGEPLDNVFFY